ncbi:hypothetical protein MKW92_052013, partial [Papaver armeniacum]
MSDKETITANKVDDEQYTGNFLVDAANRLLNDDKFMRKVTHEAKLFARDLTGDETFKNNMTEILRDGLGNPLGQRIAAPLYLITFIY